MQLSAEKPVLDTGICEIDILLTMVIVSPCSCMPAWRTLRTESSAGNDLNRFRGRDWVYGRDLYVFDGYAFFPGHLNFFVNWEDEFPSWEKLTLYQSFEGRIDGLGFTRIAQRRFSTTFVSTQSKSQALFK